MSLITVQARSAPHRVGSLSDGAEAEFAEIADRAADALRQVRSVLDVLRTEPGRSSLVPVPGLDGLAELFASARASGQQVDAHGTLPAPDRVAPEVGTAAYRIVQEALSNARRHATESRVRVDVTVRESNFEVRVANAMTSPLQVAKESHGVIGMRERANFVGGSVTAGACVPEEYVVVARLPIRHPARLGTEKP